MSQPQRALVLCDSSEARREAGPQARHEVHRRKGRRVHGRRPRRDRLRQAAHVNEGQRGQVQLL